MKGHGQEFLQKKMVRPEVDFTENVTAKKLFMKHFVKAFLRKQQEQYVSDLKKAVRN